MEQTVKCLHACLTDFELYFIVLNDVLISIIYFVIDCILIFLNKVKKNFFYIFSLMYFISKLYIHFILMEF